MRRTVHIAFRRKVRLIWLNQGLSLAAQDLPWRKAKSPLADAIARENSGAETIRKVLEHIRRIWFEPAADSAALRADALCFVSAHDSANLRTLLNWGMAIAAYPFVGSVAETTGRLLRLHHEAHRNDVQRRLREQHGDRDFVARISRYNLSSFLDWGVIDEVKKSRGSYVRRKPFAIQRPEHLAWLIEALLISRGETQASVTRLNNHPALFPFDCGALNSAVLRSNRRLQLVRHGLSEETVLRECRSA